MINFVIPVKHTGLIEDKQVHKEYLDKFKPTDSYRMTCAEEIENYKLSTEDYLLENHHVVKEQISLVSVEYATKVKIKKLNDARVVQVIKNKNILTVIPGKIDTIFTAEEMIDEYIQNSGAW